MEQLDYNLLFRWFVGLSMDDAVWDASTFSKNRERMLKGDIAEAFFQGVLGEARAGPNWETNEVRGGDSCRGAVEQNRGPHLTAVRLSQRSERCTVYRFPPGPPAGPPSHFPPSAAS
jgi:hypothetical protein